jgi:hypothetical protein
MVAHHALSAGAGLAIATAHYWCIDRRVLTMRGRLFAPKLGQALAVIAYILVGVGIAVGIMLTTR